MNIAKLSGSSGWITPPLILPMGGGGVEAGEAAGAAANEPAGGDIGTQGEVQQYTSQA